MHKCHVPNCSYATYESVTNAVLRASLMFPISTFFVLLIYCKWSLLTDMFNHGNLTQFTDELYMLNPLKHKLTIQESTKC